MVLLPIALCVMLTAAAPAFPTEEPVASEGETRYPVRVSENRRYLIDQRGQPFFYLGDTAWELFRRLDRREAEVYLKDRAAKRFTVIQAVVLPEHGGLDVPNAYGDLPLVWSVLDVVVARDFKVHP